MIRCACVLLVTHYELPFVNSWPTVDIDIDIWQFVVRHSAILSLENVARARRVVLDRNNFLAAGKLTMSTDIASQIQAELDDLEPDSQRRVLEYVRSLKKTGTGMRWDALKQYSGTITLAEAKTMTDTIEAGCEQVNVNEW